MKGNMALSNEDIMLEMARCSTDIQDGFSLLNQES